MIVDWLRRCTRTLCKPFRRLSLSPEQAEQLARIKFPCC